MRRLFGRAVALVPPAAARWIPPSWATEAILTRMRRDPAWLPPGNLEIAFRLQGTLRRIADPDGGNRWLHHRWIRLADELREDLNDTFAFPPGFAAVCLGVGTRNGLSFPLLIGLMGAERVEAVEPEPLGEGEEWRLLQGLGETALHALIGEAHGDASALPRFVHLGPLLRGESLRHSLTPALSWRQGLAESPGLAPDSIDLITSRSVMEHVADPAAAYAAMAGSLRLGGVLHHDVDFSGHETDRFAFYRRPPAAPGAAFDGLNGLRLSDHVSILRDLGLHVKVKRQLRETGPIERATLAPRFAKYDDADLLTTRAVLVAQRN